MIPKTASKSRRGPIGVFDSGVGGLSVLRELERALPHERFVFLADQSHVPYGGKTGPQLKRLTGRVVRFLLAQRCKLIVVACNTATCYAIEHLRTSFAIPFVGTVPAVKPAVALTRTGVVGVISTPATAKSPALRRLIKEFAGTVRVIRVGCPGLEELVERGGIAHPLAEELLSHYLAPLTKAGADVIVLGCTHYPFLKDKIRRIGRVRTVDSGRAVARRTRSLLASLGLSTRSGGGRSTFWTTGEPTSFARVASTLLHRSIRAKKASV